MPRQQPPRPGKGAGRGLVARQEQRDGLITKLPVGHSRTVFVLRRKKHREKIAGIAPGSAPLSDNSVQNFLDLLHFPPYAQIRGSGQPMGHKNGAPEIGADFQQQFQ